MARSPAGGRRYEDSRRDSNRPSSREGPRYDARDSRYGQDRGSERDRRNDDRRDRVDRRDYDGRRDRDHRRNYDSRRDHSRRRDYDSRREADHRRDYDDRRDRHGGNGLSSKDRTRSRSPLMDGRRHHARDDTRDGQNKRPRLDSYNSDDMHPKPTAAELEAAKKAAEEQKAAEEAKLAKQERLAKVQAWKEKSLAGKAVTNSPTVASSEAASPAPTDNDASNVTKDEPGNDTAPTLRKKFDPKDIKARVMAKSQKAKPTTLGDDVPISHVTTGKTPTAVPRPPKSSFFGSGAPLGDTKITGFGLNKTLHDKNAPRAVIKDTAPGLEEEYTVKRELKKLSDDPADYAFAHSDGLDDGADEDVDLRSDEEDAEAARSAAQVRSKAMQMSKGVEATTQPSPGDPMDIDQDDDEEEDTLDAFMKTLQDPNYDSTRRGSTSHVFHDDDGPDLDTVGNSFGLLANAVKKKKREIPDVDHDKIEYEDFRKVFFVPPAETTAMTEEEVVQMRYDLDNIKVRGRDPPRPVVSWPHCGLSEMILNVLRKQGLGKPTPIQSQAIPAIMSGRDTIGIAKTGSGKTLAFLLPMLRHIKDQRPVANLEGPIGLVIAPTRELAVQIYREVVPYLAPLHLRAMVAFGGSQIKDQIADLKRGAEIVVATAGRLIDLLAANGGRVINLRRVTYVVLDEADRMFDMGFEPQINKVLRNIRPDRQTVFFSATFPPKMEQLARKALKQPIEIQAGGKSVVAPSIKQIIEVRPHDTKFLRTLELLGQTLQDDPDARILIFMEVQERADKLFKELLNVSYNSALVHGGRDQGDRMEALDNFKKGDLSIMIATSVAARGLDVKQLKLVINYDAPNHPEDYVHRCGRTGRAGNTGTAVTFVLPEEDRIAVFLVRALKDSKQPIPEELQQLADGYNAKLKSGEVEHKKDWGFGGRGIERLDAAQNAQRRLEKRHFKTEDDAADAEDEQESAENKKATEKSKAEHDVIKQRIATAVTDVKERGASAEVTEHRNMPGNLQDQLDSFNNIQKYEEPQVPKASEKRLSPLELAKLKAAAINKEIGAQKGSARAGGPHDNRGPDAGAYHSRIVINDFPQPARWAATNRANVLVILQSTGTSITSKGIYYPPGSQPAPDGEPKLYILVEGDTEIAVKGAVRELSRHLEEGTLKAQEQEAQARASSSRYNVI